jgi:hypothetical protein
MIHRLTTLLNRGVRRGDRTPRDFFLIVGVAGASPAVLLFALAIGLGRGPQLSHAAPTAAAPAAAAPTAGPTLEITDTHRDAIETRDRLSGQLASVVSPSILPGDVAVTPMPTETSAPASPNEIIPPQLDLSSIMRGRHGDALAFIDGDLVSTGHPLADGWRITAIDPDTRSITIDHDRAEPVVITIGQ